MNDYTPIDCGVHDLLELHAMRGTLLGIEVDDGGEAGRLLARIRTWHARDGVEVAELITEDGRTLEIRLDALLAVTDPQTSRRTRISPSCAVDATSRPSRVK